MLAMFLSWWEVMLLTTLGAASLLYMWMKNRYSYWIRLGMPQPRPILGFGNLADLVLGRQSVAEVYDQIYREFPDSDAVGFYEFLTPKLMLRKPALIRQVLISDFSSFRYNEMYSLKRLDPYLELFPFLARGEQWKRSRSAFVAGLSVNKLKHMYDSMRETTPLLMAYLNDHIGKELEVKELANLFVLTNVSNGVFGVVNNCFTDSKSHFRKMADMLAKEYWQRRLLVLLVFFLPGIRDFLGYGWIPRNASKYLEDMLKHVVEERLKKNVRRKDFLQHYLDQKATVEEVTYQIISHGMSFLSAGIETTSLSSSNALYDLSKNQDIQDNLYKELKEAFDDKGEIDFNTLSNLPYLDKVVQESLRMHPVFHSQWKICTKPTELDINEKLVKIEKGTRVKIPTYSIFQDSRFFPEPEVFDPERFSEDNIAARESCTYIPFGEGPRMCPGKCSFGQTGILALRAGRVGMKFASLQVKQFIVSVVIRYRVISASATHLTPSRSAFLVIPAQDQRVRLEKRE